VIGSYLVVEITCSLCGKPAARWEDPVDEELCGECEQLKTFAPQQFESKLRQILAADHARYAREHAMPVDLDDLATEELIVRICGTEPPEIPTVEAAILLEATRDPREAIIAYRMPAEPCERKSDAAR
jgi:hypothetical protein